jgi:hypothetical protein
MILQCACVAGATPSTAIGVLVVHPIDPSNPPNPGSDKMKPLQMLRLIFLITDSICSARTCNMSA